MEEFGDAVWKSNLKYASDRLRALKWFVLLFIEKRVGAFKYVSDSLKDDKEVALVAIGKEARCVLWMSDRLQSDEAFMCMAVKKIGEYWSTQRRTFATTWMWQLLLYLKIATHLHM